MPSTAGSDQKLQLKIEFEAIAACSIPFISSSGGGSNIHFFLERWRQEIVVHHQGQSDSSKVLNWSSKHFGCSGSQIKWLFGADFDLTAAI